MKLTCDNCTLREEGDARSWITVEGLTARPVHVCSPTCLVDWAESLDRRHGRVARKRKLPA